MYNVKIPSFLTVRAKNEGKEGLGAFFVVPAELFPTFCCIFNRFKRTEHVLNGCITHHPKIPPNPAVANLIPVGISEEEEEEEEEDVIFLSLESAQSEVEVEVERERDREGGWERDKCLSSLSLSQGKTRLDDTMDGLDGKRLTESGAGDGEERERERERDRVDG